MDPITRLSALGAAGGGAVVPTTYWQIGQIPETNFQANAEDNGVQAAARDNSTGDIYIVGTYQDYSGSYIIKVDAYGVLQWAKEVLGSVKFENVYFYNSRPHVIGSILDTNWKVLWMQFNTDGTIFAQKHYGASGVDYRSGKYRYFAVDFLGNLYITLNGSFAGFMRLSSNGSHAFTQNMITGQSASTFNAVTGIGVRLNQNDVYVIGNARTLTYTHVFLRKYTWNSAVWTEWLGDAAKYFSSYGLGVDVNGNILANVNGSSGYRLHEYNDSGTFQGAWAGTASGGNGSFAIDSYGKFFHRIGNKVNVYDRTTKASVFGAAFYAESGVVQNQKIEVDNPNYVTVNNTGYIWSLPTDGSLLGTSGKTWTYANIPPASLTSSTQYSTTSLSISDSSPTTTTTTTTLTASNVSVTITPDYI